MEDLHKYWRFKAITPIWTGGVDRNERRLIPTGILGSARWWFEVLVRGLEGSACDPSNSENRCPDKQGHRCSVCELFGCTGWARKFRLDLLDDNGHPIQDAIGVNENFVFRFTPLRPIRVEEWALLDLTLQLMANYGAIGGRTVFKPSDERYRENKLHHKDYGLFEILNRPHIEIEEGQLRSYVKQSHWRNVNQKDFAWASLANFWCVHGRYLARQDFGCSTFNKVIGRVEGKNKGQHIENSNKTNTWLAGRQMESKKVFSFKSQPRTFGFVKPGVIRFDDMEGRLKVAWPSLKADEILKGPEILRIIIKSLKGAP